ncbi:outer membrane beta-barrel protein [Adhaeretor mobilis]|uniref:Outer membrane protein beta-barrel domain-containing protein n=1 Tax=Adhaeretor mobilis TaxID=1930276 RepID=A0A517MU00_9BACT|nr:outer membrane beta-barrel protein [Adhaeretor mobilis]QDS98361.1 hypothetical protein HG15A2_16350 [Adhaeretor mobilis]
MGQLLLRRFCLMLLSLAVWLECCPCVAQQAPLPSLVSGPEIVPYEESGYEEPGSNEQDVECVGCDSFGDDFGYDEEMAMHWDEPLWRPFDVLRDLGFRHSSTHGRHIGRGVPLERSSWLNRPYHVDYFIGPLLSDDLVAGSVGQSDGVFSGFRIGWDFDYYWGIQGRLGWSDPEIQTPDTTANPRSGNYFVGDVDLLYYPWGDTKVRPYMLLGVGMAEVGSINNDGTGNEVTLLGMPFGAGIEFPQTPWLAWRLEVLDNLAFGDNGVSTMHNISLTASMELRLGARPRSYWPWRSSRNVW